MTPQVTFSRGDVLAATSLLATALIYGLVFFDFTRFPSEDAAMLMRYAAHLGEGHGIVWNIDAAPVDGATDFLFMVLVAAVHRLGFPVEHAVQGLCALAQLLTTLLVYAGARRFFSAPRWAAFLSGLFIALGPGMLYTEAYFGTPFFALFVGLTWIAAMRVVERPSAGASLVFAFSALLMGLVRPEGVLVAAFVLTAIVYRLGLRRSRRVITMFALVFLVLGGAYFLWRMQYFGQPLPNPFYAKQGGHFYSWAVELSIRDVWMLTFPFNVALLCGLAAWVAWLIADPERAHVKRIVRTLGAVLIIAALLGLLRTSRADVHEALYLGRYSARYAQALVRTALIGTLIIVLAPVIAGSCLRLSSRMRLSSGVVEYLERTGRTAVFILIPVIGFTLMWGVIEDYTNYLMRFRYPIVPVIVMSWPFILAPKRTRWFAPVAVATVILSIVLVNAQLLPQRHHRDGRYDVAGILHEYRDQDYRMATTEAGLLPLYSHWPALDLFGLNDQRIARAGSVDAAYLDEFDPGVIVIAAPFPVEPPQQAGDQHMRRRIVQAVHSYADTRGFVLAAAFGADHTKVHYYYVRADIPDGNEIVDRLRAMEYTWYLTGESSADFVKR